MDFHDLHHVRHVGGVVQLVDGLVPHVQVVNHAGRSGDEIEVELPLQPLLNDFQMQQTEKAAAEAEAKCRRGFHLITERRVVQAQFSDGGAQVFEVCGIDREQAAEHDRLRGLEAGQAWWWSGACPR